LKQKKLEVVYDPWLGTVIQMVRLTILRSTATGGVVLLLETGTSTITMLISISIQMIPGTVFRFVASEI